ncbi:MULTISPECIES: HXXEE domain-containing protein [unclassified Streptomyces]|uniref:HXXEE domain-containing protein n=1 Tax=unclassified Streptomyces TaxID=2593676 RepID=UPI00278BB65A|nr:MULTISPECIES: HXXEE domain-containing protein [unclassified Streptomyces]
MGNKDSVGAAVTLGLFAAWAVHDTEEVLAAPRWLRRHLPELRERWPEVPEGVWRSLEGVDEREFRAAVGVMAGIVGAGALAGWASGGRSATYQAMLDGFGLHGLVHLAQAAAVRGYTPGVATTPTLVVPFTLWARHRLRRAGVLRPTRGRDLAAGLLWAGAATAVSHGVARRLVRKSGRVPD